MSNMFQSSWLGLELKNPLVASSSPFTGNVDSVRHLEEAGIGAVVMRSAFEEEIRQQVANIYDDLGDTGTAAALDYLRADLPMRIGPQRYVELLRSRRHAVGIPVIASVNCTTSEQWTSFAKRLEAAGADAIELNVYDIPLDPEETADEVIRRHVDLVRAVTSTVKIPVSVKLSPFYVALVNLCRKMQGAGAKGLVLFNRFMQPDINIDLVETSEQVHLSHPSDLRVPLRWTALLRDRTTCDLALSGGILSFKGVVKALLAGADVTYICSALYSPQGLGVINEMLHGMEKWMGAHGYSRVGDFRGLLRERDVADGHGFERVHYMNILGNAWQAHGMR